MNDKRKISVGIIGAAGLSAGRLIDYLLNHPNIILHSCVSESSPGQPLHSAHPRLRGRTTMKFDSLDHSKLAECDVVFSCKKAGGSFDYVAELLANGRRIIDLSGDYRLADSALYPRWYGIEHKYPELLKHRKAVYGLPEFYRDEIRVADLLANPGCYTTTSILACAPLVANGYGTEAPIIINAISGVSGAGRNASADNQYLAVSENIRAYRVGSHQHTPEIEQELAALGGQRNDSAKGVRVLFVPHVGPFKYGIMADCYLAVPTSIPMPTNEDLYKIMVETYKEQPFVRVYEPGQLPQVEFVTGTNFCDIGMVADERTRTVVVVSVTDNLVKGAAGQAIQNMNIMFDFTETAGLI